MRFDLREVSRRRLPGGELEVLLTIPSQELITFGYLLEGLEGWCSFSTVQRGPRCTVRVLFPCDYEADGGLRLSELCPSFLSSP